MININNVYQTVLVLANKDNRGYITPAEFNRMADQAQNEIFEGYFVREAGYEMSGGIESDFSNPSLNISERINLFYNDHLVHSMLLKFFQAPFLYLHELLVVFLRIHLSIYCSQ